MRGLTRAATIIAAIIGLLSAGCQDMYLADDIDIDFDFNPLTGASDTLHTPYVLGAEVTIWAHDALDDGEDEPAWTLESSNPSVLRVDSGGERHINCTAVGEGSSEIIVRDEGGERVYSGTVEVRAPSRAELYAHGPLLLGLGHDEARVDPGQPIQILSDGMATFLVRYFDGEQLLFGNGVLVAEAAENIELYEETTHFFEEREWLQIRPVMAGNFSVDLFAGDIPVGHYQIQGVTPAAVDDMELIGESERGAAEDEQLCVLAQAYDDSGAPIYGVEYVWEVSGTEHPSEGDLYRYSYDEEYDVDLVAQFQGLEDGITIHSGGGYVSSTNYIGCAMSSGVPSLPSAPTGLFLLGLGLTIAWRRRR